MALAFRSIASLAYTSRSSTTIAKPTGTAENDILIASVFQVRDGGTPSALGVPSGWTQIGTTVVATQTTYQTRFAVWWKRAGSSEPSDYTWTQSETHNTQGTIQAFSGAMLTGSPIDVFSQNNASGSEAIATSITTTAMNTQLLWISQNFHGSGTLSAPAAMTERFDDLIYLCDKLFPFTEATGAVSQSQVGGGIYAVFLVALKPHTHHRSQGAIAYGSRSSTTCPAPPVIVDGDILIAVGFAGRNVNDSQNTITPPAGFTQVRTPVEVSNSGFYGRFYTWWKRAASESGSYVFTHPVTLSSNVVVAAYLGMIATGDPVDVSSGNSGTGGTSTATGITPTLNGETLLITGHNWSANGSTTSPSGFIERYDNLVNLQDYIQPTAAATGNLTYTSGSGTGEPWQSWLIALKLASTTSNVSVDVTGDAITASVGDVTVSVPSGVTVDLTAPSGMEMAVGTVSVTASYVIAGLQYAAADSFGGSFIIDQQARDFGALGTYFTAPAAATSAYAIVSGDAMTASTATADVNAGHRIDVTGDAMTAATNPVIVTVPLVAPVFGAVTSTSYQDSYYQTSIPKPNTQVNDILLAAMFMGSSADPGDIITPPAGFTAIAASTAVSSGGFIGRFQMFWKRAGESEPASYSFEHPFISASTQIVMEAWSGCPITGDPIVAVSTASGTGTTSTATAITTTDLNSVLVFAGHCWSGAGATPPTGFEERFDFVVTMSDDEKPTVGSTGSIVSTPNGNSLGSDPWQAWLVGLKPGAGVSGGDVVVEVGDTEMAALTADVNVLAGITYPPAFRSISSVIYASRVNTTIAKPVNVAERDIILAAMFFGQPTSTDPGDGAVTPPSGFLPVAGSTFTSFSSFYARFKVFWKRATASEPDTYTFTHGTLSTQIVMQAYSRAADTGLPIQVFSTGSGFGQTSIAPSITTLTNNDTLALLGHNWMAQGTSIEPSGWTERFDNIVTCYEVPFLTAGATGIISHTPNGNIATPAYPWQSWLIALKPAGTGEISIDVTSPAITSHAGFVTIEQDAVVQVTGAPMTISDGVANARTNGGMRIDLTGAPMTIALNLATVDLGDIYVTQKAKGTSLLATTTVSFSAAPRAGHLIFLGLATNDYNANPDEGWQQSVGMEQRSYAGAYGWWRIADGVTNSFQYTVGSAVPTSWILIDFANTDGVVPYDVSAGTFAPYSSFEMTTPAIVPTLGNRLVVAIITGSGAAILTNTKLINWTNGFTSIDNSGSSHPTSYNSMVGIAYKVETTAGATSYSTSAQFDSEFTSHQPSALIIAFKKQVTYAYAAVSPMVSSAGTVTVNTGQNLSVTGNAIEAFVGGFSVTDSVGVNVRLGSTSIVATVESGSVLVPMYSGWDVATISGAASLTNSDKTLTQSELLPSTAISCIEHDNGQHYVEVTLGGGQPTGYVGLYDPVTNNGTRIVLATGQILKSPTNTLGPMFAPIVSGDVIGIAYNGDTGDVFYRVNGGYWNNDEDQNPGGFDWPGPHNTGYQNAPGYPGFLTPWPVGLRPDPNTRIEFADFPGGMTVLVPGCTFYGCRFHQRDTSGWCIRVVIDQTEFPGGSATFQFCSTTPPPGVVIPNAAWPSSGTGIDADGGSGYTPYMIAGVDSYQYGIMVVQGGALIEDCDIWGFGNSITLHGTLQKTILRTWIHDAANPELAGYHTDGPGHLDNEGCSNVLIKDCTIATFGNTNGIAFQTANIGYQDMIVRHNYLSGFGYCIDMGHNAPLNARLQFLNNIIATDLSWIHGPLYTDHSAQFAQPGFVWKGNALDVYPGSVARAASNMKFTAADHGKYVLPSRAYSTTDFQPSNALKQDPAVYYPVYASITNNTIAATATINTGATAFTFEQPNNFGDWASPNTYVDVTGVPMQVVQGGFSLSVTASGATSTFLYMGTGNLLTTAIGEESVTATAGAQCFVTGNAMTIEAGTVDIPFSQGVSVEVTGEPMTMDVGSATQGVVVTGVEMAASVGTVGVPQPVFVNVTGDAMTASAGTITLKQGQAIDVTGNLMVLEVGAVFVSLPGQAGPSTDIREGRMLDMANWMGN